MRKRKHRQQGIYWRNGTWYIDKQHLGTRISESTRTSCAVEAEKYFFKKLEEIRKENIYGERKARKFGDAVVRFIDENAHLKTINETADMLLFVANVIGEDYPLHKIHSGTMKFVEKALRVRNPSIQNRTINKYFAAVRCLLNMAARDWISETNLTWIETAPKIRMLSQNNMRKPYPISDDEQKKLMGELPEHLQRMVLFNLHTGCREAEICNMQWEWFNAEYGLFVIPAEHTKMNSDRAIVLNSAAIGIIGKPGTGNVFLYKGNPIKKMNNTAFQNARARANVPVRVHDLRHTFASRLRANNIPPHTISELLGHGAKSLTLHYSQVQFSELKTATETLVNRKTGILLRAIK
jgi:integrase